MVSPGQLAADFVGLRVVHPDEDIEIAAIVGNFGDGTEPWFFSLYRIELLETGDGCCEMPHFLGVFAVQHYCFFLKLVVAQLTTQDPLNPQKDTEFIAQMAQFTTLEQSKSMQGDIAGLRSDQHLLQANALLGRVVGLQTPDGKLARGTVNAIHLEAGKPQIMVNDQPYEVSDVVSIEAAGPNS